MTIKHKVTVQTQCNSLKQQLYTDLCKLSKRELEELGAWHGTISETVEKIAISKGCQSA